ncbi:MAG: ParB/RepB/Spo0J family partition protein [Alphaproteobacteria bacterium]
MAKGLGKGLSALLGDETTGGELKVQDISIYKLKAGEYQPRTTFNEAAIEELANSIKEKGVLQPLLLRNLDGGEYEIIAGERRWRAAKMAGLKVVPAIIRNFTREESLEVGLIENLQREDLSDIEEAEGYARLVEEFAYDQQKIADIVGKSRPYITNSLRLNKLPEPVKHYIKAGQLSGSHARTLIGEDNAIELADEIIKRGLNVRQAEALVRNQKKATPKKQKTKDEDTLSLEKTLVEKLSINVDVKKRRGNRGVISLHYDNMDQLDMILKKLGV